MKKYLLLALMMVGISASAQDFIGEYELKDVTINGANMFGKVKGKIIVTKEYFTVDYKLKIVPDLVYQIQEIEGDTITLIAGTEIVYKGDRFVHDTSVASGGVLMKQFNEYIIKK